MRGQIILGLVILLLGMALGALVTALALNALDRIEPILTEQARAQAQEAQARANREQAQAARVWLDVQAEQAAHEQIVLGKQLMSVGAGLSVFILAVGLPLALLAYLNTRARVIYPNSAGQWPILVDAHAGSVRLIDTSRGLAPVTIIRPDGEVNMAYTGQEETALQLASQAQASGLLAGMTGKMTDPLKALDDAGASLPTPTFTPATDGIRFVHVHGGQTSRADLELAELREFIIGAATRTLARSAWVGRDFGTGRRCTRSHYDKLIERLKHANLVIPDGQSHKLNVSPEQALAAFGL